MQFHFVQDVYQKKQPGTNIRKKTYDHKSKYDQRKSERSEH